MRNVQTFWAFVERQGGIVKSKAPRPKVLMVASDIGGHRVLHLRRFAKLFLDADFHVSFWADKLYGRSIEEPNQDAGSFARLLQDLASWENVSRVSELLPPDGRKRLKLIETKSSTEAFDIILFADAEGSLKTITRLEGARARGLQARTIGYFFESSFLYWEQMKQLEKAKSLLLHSHRALENFFKIAQHRFPLLDLVVVNDDQIIKTYDPPNCVHMWELPPLSFEDEVAEGREIANFGFAEHIFAPLQSFLTANDNKLVGLQFGDLEPRKGFDLTLEFATRSEEVAVLRAGRRKPSYRLSWSDVQRWELLLTAHRLHSIDLHLPSELSKKYLYQRADFALLPYRNHLRTSGVLADCIREGLPVLVSSGGVKARLVAEYGIGEVFEDGSIESLVSQWGTFRQNIASYAAGLERAKSVLEERYAFAITSMTGLTNN